MEEAALLCCRLNLRASPFIHRHIRPSLAGRDIIKSYLINSQVDPLIPAHQGFSGELMNQQEDGLRILPLLSPITLNREPAVLNFDSL